MAVERTLVLVKPNGVARGLTGEVIARFERRGFELTGARLLAVSTDLAERHYGEHVGKPFFDDLVAFITSGPVMAMVVQGPSAVGVVRGMMGTTNPVEAAPGTIRGDFALDIGENIVHGSDSVESAEREIGLFFSDDQLVRGS
jgi:nucleoside-diphosphate kinase